MKLIALIGLGIILLGFLFAVKKKRVPAYIFLISGLGLFISNRIHVILVKKLTAGNITLCILISISNILIYLVLMRIILQNPGQKKGATNDFKNTS